MEITTDSEMFVSNVRREFRKRSLKNSSYSLRAFARSLDVSAASLSGLLSGQRPLTQKMVCKIATGLNLSPQKTDMYLNKIFRAKRGLIVKKAYEEQLLSEDQFLIISDWVHFAILRLIKTKDFKSNINWIAKRLNVNSILIQEAVDRLIRLELLKIDGKEWIDQSNGNTSYVKTTTTNANIKSFLKKMKLKSIHSLEIDPIEVRNHTGMMLTISEKSLPLAKELITNFRKSLAEILENDQDELDQVYFLEVGLFPITNTINTVHEKEKK